MEIPKFMRLNFGFKVDEYYKNLTMNKMLLNKPEQTSSFIPWPTP